MSRLATFVACTSLSAGLLAADQPSGARPAAGSWPQFLGPAGNGHAGADAAAPTTWDAKSLVWKTELRGRGQSTPVVWGDRMFLTTALEGGRERLVLALDRETGKVLWEQVAWTGNPEPSHEMNGWASPSVTTDGKHVWAWFGRAGVHCYAGDGTHVWSQQLGEFKIKTGRGTGSSLLLVGDVLIVNGDSESDPYLFGLDKATGKTVWKTERPATEGYSSPILVTANGRPEVVLNGDPFVAAYDPATGKQLWQCKSFKGRGEPVPAVGADNTLYVVNGLAADVYAVKPGGDGDVTATHRLWHTPRKEGRDLPSPVAIGPYVLVSNMAGIVTCYDAKTGKELHKQRVGDAKAKISSAPVVAGGKAYLAFEGGEVVVVEPAATELKVVARNKLDTEPGEIFRASPVPLGGRVYLRSDRAAYCVK